jgi:hypothetical protein
MRFSLSLIVSHHLFYIPFPNSRHRTNSLFDIPDDMLCEFCALIDLDRLYGSSTDYENVPSAYGTAMIPGYALIPEDRHQYPHHTSYKDLIISAENGCDLCTMIWMRDIQRRHHAPWDCSVLGWEKLQVLDALSESDDGFSLVSIPKLGSLNGCVYKIDSQSDPRIYCSVGFTENWCEGWEVAVGPDIGPQDLRFYQEGSTNDIVGVGLHSRLAISIEHGKNVNILIFNFLNTFLTRHRRYFCGWPPHKE